MRSIWILMKLTIKETVRKKLFLVSVVVALFFFVVSLMPMFFGAKDVPINATGVHQSVAVMMVVFMGVPMLKFFAAVEVVGLSCGAIAGEIERGLLAVILPKPMARWQLVLAKWLAINLLMAGNIVFWTLLLWISLLIQKQTSYPTLFYAGLVSILYPLCFSTLTLFFSSFATAPLAMGMAMMCGGAAWPHALLRTLGDRFDIPALFLAGDISRYIVPMNHIGLWVEQALGPLQPTLIDPRGFLFPIPLAASVKDLFYVGAYIIGFLLATLVVFHRRDVN